MSRMLARIERHRLAQEHAQLVDQALQQAGGPTTARSAPADERRLRGIPAIGRGVAGHIPGTQPEQAALLDRTSLEERAARGARRRRDGRERSRAYAKKAEIFERDAGVCYLCGQALDVSDVEIDHVIPLARGGTNDLDNLRVVHPSCNRAKGDRLVGERRGPYTSELVRCESAARPPMR